MEFFALPFAGAYVLYFPTRQTAFMGNHAVVDYLKGRKAGRPSDEQIDTFLEAAGLDTPGPKCPDYDPALPPAPTHAVLLMTNGCNLRCVYCYANAGEEGPLERMPWIVAQATIDTAARNAKARGEPLSVTFHGGGEPTTHWDLLRRCVEYARERSPAARISMSSNGVWTASQRNFICQHFTNVSLSLDGLAEVQNRQRPLAGGGGTADSVRDSLRAMDEAGLAYGIRMTVLPASVQELPEAVRELCATTRASAIQIEPTFTDRPGHYADLDESFADRFSESFMEARDIGLAAGRTVYYSAARPEQITPVFCTAPEKALIATADGRLVTCFEIFGKNNPLATAFTVGRVNQDGATYDETALRAYVQRLRERRRECEDCFCYRHCGGDCVVRRPGGRDLSRGRCKVTREITLRMILRFIENSGGVWRGTSPAEACSCHE